MLIVTVTQRGGANFIVGVVVYAATLVGLYLGSTLYHALSVGGAKSEFLVCGHAAIYVFVAGTYTPFTLGVLRGPWGLALLIAVWGLALAGSAFKVTGEAERYPKLLTAVCLGMGWVFLLAAGPVWDLMPSAGLLSLLAGGISRLLPAWPSCGQSACAMPTLSGTCLCWPARSATPSRSGATPEGIDRSAADPLRRF